MMPMKQVQYIWYIQKFWMSSVCHLYLFQRILKNFDWFSEQQKRNTFSRCVVFTMGQYGGWRFWRVDFLIFFIFICINDLPDNLLSNPKLFTDNTTLFSAVINHTQYDIDFNADLSGKSELPFQWEMNSNPNLTKQV